METKPQFCQQSNTGHLECKNNQELSLSPHNFSDKNIDTKGIALMLSGVQAGLQDDENRRCEIPQAVAYLKI